MASSAINNGLGIAVGADGSIYVAQAESSIDNILKLTPATTAANFAGVNVGSQSATISLFFDVESGGVIGAPSVVTQGISGLDFTDAATGSCTQNGWTFDYAAGATCAVNVLFTPTRAGARYGAAILKNSAGTAIATGYVQGVGIGPQISFPPPAVTHLSLPGVTNPYAVAVDAAGNLYIAQAIVAYDPNNALIKETWNGGSYTSSTIAAGLAYPTSVAVDGAGNVYFGDQDGFTVYKETPVAGGGYQRSVVDNTLGTVGGLAVDASGNVYIGRGGIGIEKESLSSGTYVRSDIFPDAGNTGFAVDSAGAVYLGIYGQGTFKETPTSAGYVQTAINVEGIDAVDGLGNLYYVGPNGVYEEVLSGNSYAQTTLATGVGGIGMAVDGSGSVYLANDENRYVAALNITRAPALQLSSTSVGQTSSDSPQTVTIANAGNAALNVPVPGSGNNPTISAGFNINDNAASACPVLDAGSGAPGTLAAGASCEFAVSFSPTAAGAVTGSLILTDNNLNAAPPNYTTQTIALSGSASPGTPTITWPAPTPIAYGTMLGSSQLDPTASIAGSFSYSPTAGTMLTVGTHTLTGTFTPADTTNYTSATAATSLTVNQATPGIALAASSYSVFLSTPVTLTAALAPASGAASGAALPTGSVAFFDGTAQLAVVPLNSGTTSYTTSALTGSTQAITAVYSGDANYLTATSPVVNETVENFTIAPSTGSSTAATTSPGREAVYTLVFSPPTGASFPATINLTVAGLPAGATAVFSPASIPAGAGATTVTLTISVPNSSAMAFARKPSRSNAPLFALGLIVLPCVLIKRKNPWLRDNVVRLFLLSFGGAALLTGIVGCSGSGSGSSSGPQSQTYTLTVTATSGALSNTTSLSLTVHS